MVIELRGYHTSAIAHKAEAGHIVFFAALEGSGAARAVGDRRLGANRYICAPCEEK